MVDSRGRAHWLVLGPALASVDADGGIPYESMVGPKLLADYVARIKRKEDGLRLMGFGHRIYRNFDPRAHIMKETADRLVAKLKRADPLLEIAKRLEELAEAKIVLVSVGAGREETIILEDPFHK